MLNSVALAILQTLVSVAYQTDLVARLPAIVFAYMIQCSRQALNQCLGVILDDRLAREIGHQIAAITLEHRGDAEVARSITAALLGNIGGTNANHNLMRRWLACGQHPRRALKLRVGCQGQI